MNTTNPSNTRFTPLSEDDIINILEEEEGMISKFYNNDSIILYAYIDNPIAIQLLETARLNQPIQHLIATPIELYESPYTAKLLTANIKNKKLIAFAIYVVNNIFDELDLQLEERIRQSKKSENDIRKEVSVIRKFNTYKQQGKSSKPYISYIIQNQNAITNIFSC